MNDTKEPEFRDAGEAYDYAYKNKCKLILKGELLISSSVVYSCEYAVNILHSRFKLGEEKISKSRPFSLLYINDIFDGCAPIDFLELCSIKVLNYILDCKTNTKEEDLIKILFKKKILNNEKES